MKNTDNTVKKKVFLKQPHSSKEVVTIEKNKCVFVLGVYRKNFPSFLAPLYFFLVQLITKLTYTIKVVPLIKKTMKKNRVVLVAMDSIVEEILKKNKLEYKTQKDYISSEELKSAEEDAISIVRSLPLDKGFKDHVSYKNYSLWELNELDAWGAFFSPIMKKIAVVEKVIEKEKPDCAYTMDRGLYAQITEQIAEKKGVKAKKSYSVLSNFISSAINILMPYILKTIKTNDFKRIKPKKQKKPARKIIVFTVEDRDLTVIEPWFRLIKNKSTIVGFEECKKTYKDFDFVSYGSYYPKINFKNTKKTLLYKYRHLLNNKEFKNNLSYKGLNLWPFTKDLFSYLFLVRFIETIFYIELFSKLLNEERPSLAVTTDDRSMYGRIIIDVCKENKIKSLIVQHGMIVYQVIYGPIKANSMAVFGEHTKNVLVKRGVNPKKIIVTGQPRFDTILSNKKYRKNETCVKLRISPDKKIILFTSQPLEKETNEVLFDCVMRAAKNLDLQLLIKLHPGEKKKLPIKIKKALKSNAVILKNFDLYKLINASDLTITYFSTTGLEALMMGKPLINLNLTGEEDKSVYAKEGVALGAKNLQELEIAVKKILKENITKRMKKNINRFVYEHTYKQDGKASERVAKLIEEMAKSK